MPYIIGEWVYGSTNVDDHTPPPGTTSMTNICVTIDRGMRPYSITY